MFKVGINPVKRREGVSVVVSGNGEVYYDSKETDHGDIIASTSLRFQPTDTLLRADYSPITDTIRVSFPDKAHDLFPEGYMHDQYVALYNFLSDEYPELGVMTEVRMLAGDFMYSAQDFFGKPDENPDDKPYRRSSGNVDVRSYRRTY